MERYPPIPPASLTEEQRPIHDHIDSMCKKFFGEEPPFALKNDSGALLGPFPMIV
jgi:hypothetical protein